MDDRQIVELFEQRDASAIEKTQAAYGRQLNAIAMAAPKDCDIIVFPELSTTGYTCGDLFLQSRLLEAGDEALARLLATPRPIVSIVGMPIYYKNNLYNCAVVIYNGKIEGIVPKSYIPNYSEFYESRWFTEGRDIRNTEIVICGQRVRFGAEAAQKQGATGLFDLKSNVEKFKK